MRPKLLEVSGNGLTAIPAPEIAQIKEFSELIKKHKGDEAKKRLAFVYHMVSMDSPYSTYVESLREEKLKKDIIGDGTWKIDKETSEAINKFTELNASIYLKLLESAWGALLKLKQYYDTVDFTILNEDGEPIHDPNKVMLNISRLGGAIESVEKLKLQVEKESEKGDKIRKGIERTKYNT